MLMPCWFHFGNQVVATLPIFQLLRGYAVGFRPHLPHGADGGSRFWRHGAISYLICGRFGNSFWLHLGASGPHLASVLQACGYIL